MRHIRARGGCEQGVPVGSGPARSRRRGPLLIRVRCAGVNPLDSNLLGRLTAESAYPFVVGIDFAGVAERVPVMGATGGVGGYAVQLARSRGAHVIATVRGDADEARRLGVEEVYDSQATDVIDALRAAHPDGVDAVLDLVSGRDAIRRDAEVIRPGGRLVSTVFAADEGWFAQRQITAHNHASSANPLISVQGLTTVAQLFADGTITARIRSTVDLDGAGRVLDDLRRGGLRGKAVIRL